MQTPSETEISLRQAIGHINTAKGYIERLDYQVTLDAAYVALDEAIDMIRDWAERHEITIKESMHT